MSLRKIIAGGLMVATMASSCDFGDEEQWEQEEWKPQKRLRKEQKVQQDTAQAIYKVLPDSVEEKAVEPPTPPVISDTSEMYTVNMDRVRKGPLGKMKNIAHDLRILLGASNVDSFMRKYNKGIADTLVAHNPRLKKDGFRWVGYEKLPDLKVPMVNPKVKDFFDASLEDFLADKEDIRKGVDTSTEVVIMTRQPIVRKKTNKKGVETTDTLKKHVIGYYKDGKLVFADYMSGGEGVDRIDRHKTRQEFVRVHAFTPEGVFDANYENKIGDKRDSQYVSRAFDAAMPYAVPFQPGTYLHVGLTNGSPLSHGCARQNARIAILAHDMIGDRKVKIVVSGLYDPGQEERARKGKPLPYKGKHKRNKKPKKPVETPAE